MQLYQVSKTLLVIGKNLALEGCARTVQCHVMSFNSIMHHMIIYCQTLPSRKHSRYARELNKLKIILQSVSATDVVCSADIMRCQSCCTGPCRQEICQALQSLHKKLIKDNDHWQIPIRMMPKDIMNDDRPTT